MSRVDDLPCRRCGRPVRLSRASFDVFEQMHYVCFHYEFEHDPFDVDEECGAGGCPAAAVNPRPMRRPENELALRELNVDLADRLSAEHIGGAQEYLDVGEWGLALECLAEWLAEDSLPITDEKRQTFQRLATLMDIQDRVMRAVDLCPGRDPA